MKTGCIILLLLAISTLMPQQAQAEGYAEDFGRWEAGSVPGYPWESVTVEGGGDFYVVEGGGTVSDKFVSWNREGANNQNSVLLLDARHNTGHVYTIINQNVVYTSSRMPGNGIVLRWHDQDNYWLISQARNTELALHRRLEGEWQSHGFRARGRTTPMHYRVEDDGQTIRVKAWGDDQLEPDSWQIQHQSDVLAGGRVGLGIGTRVSESVPTHFFSTLKTGNAHSFRIDQIAPEQTVGRAFSITITALDEDGNVVEDYAGAAYLRDSTGTITPNLTGELVRGRWRGEVSIMRATDDANIIAGFADVRGMSNTFAVIRTPTASLSIHAETTEIDAGELVGYRLTGTDELGLAFDATHRAKWSIDDKAAGSWDRNVYHTGMFGDWTVTAEYDGVKESTRLSVRPMPIITESAYMRAWLLFEEDRVDGQLLREKGREILGRTAFQRTQRSLVRQLEEAGVENAAAVWFEHVRIVQPHQAYGIVTMPWPSADWSRPDFDDHDWVLRRMPLQVGRNSADSDAPMQASINVRAAMFRARFGVEDPHRDGPYTLWLQYRGGVRVFVNGVELARGHLPDGDLDNETLAERYPIDAYLLNKDELPAEEVEANKQRNNGVFNIYDQTTIVRDVPVRYEEAGEATSQSNLYHDISQETWNRLYDARERELGPITIPPEMLHKGSNVIAIELRRAPIHPVVLRENEREQSRSGRWFPPRISRIDLRAASAAAPSALKPPQKFQVWVQDHHSRMHENDFLPEGTATGRIHFVAAKNGTFGTQVGVRSNRKVENLRIDISEFRQQDGTAIIPSEAISVFNAQPPSRGSWGAVGGQHRWGMTPDLDILTNTRYGHEGSGRILDELTYLPQSFAADKAHSIYLSLRTPTDVPAGNYTGTVTISADGVTPIEVPVTIELHDWTLPDPQDFRTVFGVYSQPVALARAHRVETWSERHFELLETGLRHLARFGGKWVDVPVLETSKFIRWIRRADGQLRFEFDQLDRFLDFFEEIVGKPRIVVFTIMWAQCDNYRAHVPVYDEASGKTTNLSLGPDVKDDVRRIPLTAFHTALYEYMASRGLSDTIYWGLPWDALADERLVRLMREIAPDVSWTRRSHARLANETDTVTSTVYAASALPDARIPGWGSRDGAAGEVAVDGLHSAKGWRSEYIQLVNSRANNTIHWCEGYFPPISYRIYPTRAITAGYSGIGTISLDGWESRGGYRNSVEWHLKPGGGRSVGSGINRLLWNSADGLRSGIRVEVMLEGFQQAETRIFIEQALLDGILPEELAQHAKKVLNAEFGETGYILILGGRSYALHDHDQGWQPRSRRMFALAAEVAKYVQ